MPCDRALMVSLMDRRMAPMGASRLEPAENVAGTEADEQAVHLWKHVGGEEGDGDGVPIFEVEPHIRWQVGAHLLKRVTAAGFEP